MNKTNFEKALQKWLDKNSNKSLHASIMLKTAKILDIAELYQDDNKDVSINETIYAIYLPESLSSTNNQNFLFKTLDLLVPDEYGDITCINTISYSIITNI